MREGILNYTLGSLAAGFLRVRNVSYPQSPLNIIQGDGLNFKGV